MLTRRNVLKSGLFSLAPFAFAKSLFAGEKKIESTKKGYYENLNEMMDKRSPARRILGVDRLGLGEDPNYEPLEDAASVFEVDVAVWLTQHSFNNNLSNTKELITIPMFDIEATSDNGTFDVVNKIISKEIECLTRLADACCTKTCSVINCTETTPQAYVLSKETLRGEGMCYYVRENNPAEFEYAINHIAHYVGNYVKVLIGSTTETPICLAGNWGNVHRIETFIDKAVQKNTIYIFPAAENDFGVMPIRRDLEMCDMSNEGINAGQIISKYGFEKIGMAVLDANKVAKIELLRVMD